MSRGGRCLICKRYTPDFDAHDATYHSALQRTEFVMPGRPAEPVERRGCPGHSRHWFAPRGLVSVSVPWCVRCGAPNPKWSSAVAAEMESMGYGAEWRAEMGYVETEVSASANHDDSGSSGGAK